MKDRIALSNLETTIEAWRDRKRDREKIEVGFERDFARIQQSLHWPSMDKVDGSWKIKESGSWRW